MRKQGGSVKIPSVQTRNFPCVSGNFPHFSTNTSQNAENFSISETSRRIKPEFSDFFGIFSVLCCEVKVLSSVFHSFYRVLFPIQLMTKVFPSAGEKRDLVV